MPTIGSPLDAILMVVGEAVRRAVFGQLLDVAIAVVVIFEAQAIPIAAGGDNMDLVKPPIARTGVDGKARGPVEVAMSLPELDVMVL